LTLQEFRISAGNTLIQASGSLARNARASLDVSIDLAGLAAGIPLAGRATGSIGLEELSLDSMAREALRMEDLRVAGATSSLDGLLELRGKTSSPGIDLQLHDTSAGGSLELHAQPFAGTFELDSTLQFAGVGTDVLIVRSRDSLAADGAIEVAG